jgi:integrase/recombinase XerD
MSRGRKLPVFYTPDEARALVVAAPTRRDRLIMLIGLLAGLRVSEICHLRAQDLDWQNKQIFVNQGKGKKDRYVPIHKKLEDPLRQWLGDKTYGWVFPSVRCKGKPICTRTVQLMMAKAGRKAKMSKRSHPHGLRHSCFSRLIQRGADIITVRDLAGHSSIQTTQAYLHTDASRMREALKLL